MIDEICDDCDEQQGKKPECRECDFYEEAIAVNGCPNICNHFKCVLTPGKCRKECNDLELTKSLICAICTHQNSCDAVRQRVLLGTKYLDAYRASKTSSLASNFGKVKERHSYLEQRYKELKSKGRATSRLNLPKRVDINKEGSRVVFELEIYRKIMDDLEIPYKKNVELKPKN